MLADELPVANEPLRGKTAWDLINSTAKKTQLCKGLEEEGIATGIPYLIAEMKKHKRGEIGHDA